MTTNEKKLWFQNAEDVKSVFHELVPMMPTGLRAHSDLVRYLDNAYQKVRRRASPLGIGHYPMDKTQWLSFFKEAAVTVVEMLSDDFDLDTFANLLLAKHRAYGMEPLTEFYETGILIRIGSKVQRLKNLLQTNDRASELVGDEAIEDTELDIIGYCVLGYYMTRSIPTSKRY